MLYLYISTVHRSIHTQIKGNPNKLTKKKKKMKPTKNPRAFMIKIQ